MAAIDQYLRQILEATYGEEVRHSIHDAILQNYNDVSEATELANTAATNADTAAQNADTKAQLADTAATNANEKATLANTAATRANQAAASVKNMTGIVAPTYSASDIYKVGQYAVYNEQLYRCIVEISTAEEWTAAHWTAVPLGNEVSDLKSALNTKAPAIINSASGTIASFEDGADDLPVESLKVAIEPVQDLHGYDHPWPGGGGKNLTGYTTPFVGTVDANTQPTLFSMSVEAGKTYTFSCKQSATIPTSTRNTIGIKQYGYSNVTYENTSTDYNPPDLRHTITFTAEVTGDCAFILWSHTPSVSVTYDEWQVEESNEFTRYAPYSNICPITGFDSVKVTRTGKNLINPALSPARDRRVSMVTYENGDNEVTITTISNTNYMCLGLFYNIKAGTYTIKYKATSSDDYVPLLTVYGSSTTVIINNIVPDTERTFTINKDQTVEFRLFASTIDNGTANRVVRFYQMQLERGSTATEYEPYAGQTYDITLPTEAGTVYGGTLDVSTGELVVDRAMVDMGSLVWIYNTTYVFFNSQLPPNRKIGVLNIWSDIFKTRAGSWSGTPLQNALWGNGSNTGFYVQWPSIDNVSDFMTLVNGHQLMYELATPITYTLTAEQVRTLLGHNNIWADTGDVDVSYRADTKLYIDNKITQAIAAAMNS